MAATNITGDTFYLYLNQPSSIGLQFVRGENMSLTMQSGELNSSTTTLVNDYLRGYLIFNSSSIGGFIIDFSPGLKTWFNDNALDTGDSISYVALTDNILRWDIEIYDPFEHYFFPVIGLIGFIMTAASGFYTAQTIRNRDEDVMKYSYGIVLLILGIGFIMVWFYG